MTTGAFGKRLNLACMQVHKEATAKKQVQKITEYT